MKIGNIKKPIIISLTIIIIVVGGWLLLKIINGNYISQFNSSKQRIGGLIQQINVLASQSNTQFQLIEEKQKKQEIKNALDLVITEKERNREINETAVKLTKELEELTKVLAKIPNKDDRQKLEQAIQYQIQGISHLLNYGSGVDTILEELAQKYESILDGRYFEIKRNISQLIALIRQEITEADQNSQEFVKLISEIK